MVSTSTVRAPTLSSTGPITRIRFLASSLVNPNLDAIAEAKIALAGLRRGIQQGNLWRHQQCRPNPDRTNSTAAARLSSTAAATSKRAIPFTNKPRRASPAANWKQFGGSGGGPIIKNKLFFFGDYQGTKQTAGITNLYTIPTTLAQQTCTQTTGNCDPERMPCVRATVGQCFQPALSTRHLCQPQQLRLASILPQIELLLYCRELQGRRCG